MKKLFVVAFAVVALVVANPNKAEAAYSSGTALGVGWGGYYYDSNTPGWDSAYLTGQIPGVPFMFGLQLWGWGNYFGLSLSADKWLFNPNLLTLGGFFELDFYFGVGARVGLEISNNNFDLNLGARLPIGLSWRFFECFELFTEFVPFLNVIGIGIGNDTHFRLLGIRFGNNGGVFNEWNLFGMNYNFGLRYWF